MTDTTPIDFYHGRGENKARYLGTMEAATGLPPVNMFWSLDAREYTQERYDAVVRSLISTETWPHDYPDSTRTPWAVAYDKGTVYVYREGVEMLQIRCNTHANSGPRLEGLKTRQSRPVNDFPHMLEGK